MSTEPTSPTAPAPAAPPLAETAPAPRFADDLFSLGLLAMQRRKALHRSRASFARTKRLLPDGSFRGPRDAAEAYVDEADLGALGGPAAAVAAGARTLLGRSTRALAEGLAAGLRTIAVLPYQRGHGDDRRLGQLRALLGGAPAPWGLLPEPEGEPEGLDTLRLFALLRGAPEAPPHLLADFSRLSHRLAQMALGFGADELWGPVVGERALRLGSNANNPALTRKEAAILIRGAGLAPYERTGPKDYEACP